MEMTLEDWLGSMVAFALLLYVGYSLIHPERF